MKKRKVSSINKASTDSVDIGRDRRETFTLCQLERYPVISATPWYSRLYGGIAFRQWNIRRASTRRAGYQALVRRAYLSHRYLDFTTRNDVSQRGKEKCVSTDKTQQTELPRWCCVRIFSLFAFFLNFSLLSSMHDATFEEEKSNRISNVSDPSASIPVGKKKLLFMKCKAKNKQIIISGTCFAVIEIANDRNGAPP